MGTAIETTQGRDADADAGNKRHPTALLSSAYSYAQGSFNSLISPSSRQRAFDAASSFAAKQPILFVPAPVQQDRDGTQSPKSEDTLVGAEVTVPNGVEVKKEDRFEEVKSTE
ncbi:hypothetical protein TrVFT333_011666 [Trichoderma virens FT-333]|nr:hypothetical protein TrVFT333_011666 [Trichoderma virens FT-333]